MTARPDLQEILGSPEKWNESIQDGNSMPLGEILIRISRKVNTWAIIKLILLL